MDDSLVPIIGMVLSVANGIIEMNDSEHEASIKKYRKVLKKESAIKSELS